MTQATQFHTAGVEPAPFAGVEGGDVNGRRLAIEDHLGHRLAGRWCIEDAPDAVPGAT